MKGRSEGYMNSQLLSRPRRVLPAKRRAVPVLAVATGMIASVTLGAQAGAAAQPRHHEGASVTITAALPDLTGLISAADNSGLRAVTKAWENMHPGVTVSWYVADPHNSGVPNNALLVTQASGGDAPDLVFESAGTEDSVPAGILANLAPFLNAKDPYDSTYPTWLDTFSPLDPPYMKDTQGVYELVNASAVGAAMFYNKAIFARAHISAPPTTYAQWIADMQAIKTTQPGVYPFLLTTGANCGPLFWEGIVSTALLAPWAKELDVNHSQVFTGVDVATGVAKNIISMKNPAYAEVWKLLAQLQQYEAPGASQYDLCATPGTTTPPLSPQSLMVKGKVAMLLGGSWWPQELASQGFAGKWGAFGFPTLTKATTPYATGLNVSDVISSPDGDGQWAVSTQKAAHNMTPSTMALVINLLQYLTAPNVIDTWLGPTGNGFPLVKGAPPLPGGGALPSVVVPATLPPVGIYGVEGDLLTTATTNAANRQIEEYAGGSLSFSAFSSEMQTLLTQGAQQWAATAKVHIPGL
jgi:raffinose/stachyose/melibiose transport system substrate-binding protein